MSNLIIEKYIQEAKRIANDDSYTYSMIDRWGKSLDCSSFVITSVHAAISTVATGYGDTTVLKDILTSNGFIYYPYSHNHTSLTKGDIIIDPRSGANGHTLIYLGNNSFVHAATHYATHPEDDIIIRNDFDVYMNVTKHGFTQLLRYKITTSINFYDMDYAYSIYSYLVNNGLTNYQASAVMSNIYSESRGCAWAVEGYWNRESAAKTYSDNNYTSLSKFLDNKGYSLAQWTISSRKRAYWNWVNGVVGDLDKSKSYLLHDLQTYTDTHHGYTYNWNNLRASQTIEDSMRLLFHGYENPADQSESAFNVRLNNAIIILQDWGGVTPPSPSKKYPFWLLKKFHNNY